DETVATEGGRYVLRLRTVSGAARFRLTLDAVTALPRTLEPSGRDDLSITFDDYRPSPAGRIPHRITMRQAWLVDRLQVSSIDTPTGDGGSAINVKEPDDVRWGPLTAAVAARFTRGKLPLVRPRIDGRDVGWFVIDTGAGATASMRK